MSTSTLTRSIVENICSAIDAGDIWHEPFTHLYMRGVFPEDVYTEFHERLPELSHFKDLKHKEALRKDGSSSRKVLPFGRLDSIAMDEQTRDFWMQLRDAMNAPELQQCLFRRMARGLSARLGVSEEAAEGLEAWPQNGLFRDLSGYRISPHKDVRTKYVTSHFYLPRDAGQRDLGTSIYKRNWVGRINRELNKLGAALHEFQPVRTFEFLPNTGYAFVVGSQSWHGRDTVPEGRGERLSVMNIYYNTREVPFYE